MSSLQQEFSQLGQNLERLLALLEEADETFWRTYLVRGQDKVAGRELAGATYILGCFGGMDTFSDLVLARDLEAKDPMRFKNLNARLHHLRTEVFTSCRKIASRELW